MTISEDEQGNFILNGTQHIVEYAVKMLKIPEEKMLYRLLAEKKTDLSIMEKIAEKIYEFHQIAATGGKIDKIGTPDTIKHNHIENFDQTKKYIGNTISENQHAFIKNYSLGFLQEHHSLFEKRRRNHKIRDCHGDLHLQHICVSDDIFIFDCIEFNERFRYLDVAAEVAFLAMDLDYNGYLDYSESFVNAYIQFSSDREIKQLLNFYKCYFAYVRGKVTSFKLDDESVAKKEELEALKTASQYFSLAYTYAAHLEKPTLILTTGLMGTGKSFLARKIAPILEAEVIRTDIVRKELLGVAHREHHYEAFGQGIYSLEITEKTYAQARNLAEELILSGKSVIIDASFKEHRERIRAYNLARKLEEDFFVIECICPEEIVKKRLETRITDTEEVSDGRWEIYETQKNNFEPVHGISDTTHIVINTSQSPEKCIAQIIEKIRAPKHRSMELS